MDSSKFGNHDAEMSTPLCASTFLTPPLYKVPALAARPAWFDHGIKHLFIWCLLTTCLVVQQCCPEHAKVVALRL